jgi:hypothetical protein
MCGHIRRTIKEGNDQCRCMNDVAMLNKSRELALPFERTTMQSAQTSSSSRHKLAESNRVCLNSARISLCRSRLWRDIHIERKGMSIYRLI